MLASQNSKNGHNWGLEITPEMFRPLFRQEISRLTISTYREGLKRLIFRFFFFEKMKIRELEKTLFFEKQYVFPMTSQGLRSVCGTQTVCPLDSLRLKS